MKRYGRALLWVQAALCVAVAAWLAWAAVDLCREGLRLRAAGDVSAWIFTRERVARRLAPILPLALASLGVTVAGLALGVRDVRRDASRQAVPTPVPVSRRVNRLRLALLALAAGLILHGALNGSMRDVLAKAVNICTECVGLG